MASANVLDSIPCLDVFLTNEESQLLTEVRDFAQAKIAKLAVSLDKNNEFPLNLWPEMGGMGILGPTVPEEFGGLGQGYFTHVLIMEEISRASASVGLSYGAHSNLCVNQINLNGTAEQKLKYLPDLLTGKKVGALAMSESEAGSDVTSMKLEAKAQGDGFILNGQKMWITNGPEASTFVVYAKTEPEKGTKGITAFIVESTFEGFKKSPKLDKLGMRGSNTCELLFNNCFVPQKNILGQLNAGVKVLMSGLDYERLVLAAGPLGIMRACLDQVLPYIAQRKQFGQAIGNFELIQGKVADMYTAYSAARSYVHIIAKACDQGLPARKDAAGTILFAAERATQVALDAIQILGANGYTNEYPCGRFLRDAKLYEIGAGTSEIRRMLIGRELYREQV